MRILEHCISSATPEVQLQINALREAFSQDTNKPFELKQALGLRSPSVESQATPPDAERSNYSAPVQGANAWSHMSDPIASKTLSPASEYAPPFDPMATQHPMLFNRSGLPLPNEAAYAPTSVQQVTSAPQQGYTLEPVISNEQHAPVWDPSGIFQQWNTAFGVQAQTPPQQAPIQNQRVAPTSAPVMQQPQHTAATQQTMYASHHTASSASSVMPASFPAVPTVTPVMWQDAFTNAYVSGHGHKRYRDEGLEQMPYDQYPKRRG